MFICFDGRSKEFTEIFLNISWENIVQFENDSIGSIKANKVLFSVVGCVQKLMFVRYTCLFAFFAFFCVLSGINNTKSGDRHF